MPKVFCLALILGIWSASGIVSQKAVSKSAAPVPENGGIARGVYENDYFDLRYRLPADWEEDIQGPPASVNGYYSLIALRPVKNLSGTALIAAQDEFFASEPTRNPEDFLSRIRENLDSSLTISPQGGSVVIGGHPFARLDYSGAGLYHSIYAAEIRCHMVIFSFTSSSQATIEQLASPLSGAFGLRSDQRDGFDEHSWPVCVRDYAAGGNVLHRVEAASNGPRFGTVPARFVIDVTGRVKSIHVIAGFPEQRESVRVALAQWLFKPYRLNGKPAEVETGLMFRFGEK